MVDQPPLFSKLGRESLRYVISKRLFNPILRPMGFTLLSDHFHQPIPTNSELRAAAGKKRPLDGIAWDLPAQIAHVERLLKEFDDEIADPKTLGALEYDPERSGLGTVDAAILYATLRSLKPARVLEVGAGGSTLIIAAALARNQKDTGRTASLTSIDPYPVATVRALAKDDARGFDMTLLEQPVQETSPEVFATLSEGDVLFIDSSHCYRTGSDVEFEFLRLYPRMPAGVTVHIHDIFFPYDYPLEWNTQNQWFWNEQYVLEAFLMFNSKYEVLASLSMVDDTKPGLFRDRFPATAHETRPGSFWMKAIH